MEIYNPSIQWASVLKTMIHVLCCWGQLLTGSYPVCYSPVPSCFNMDECHVETKQSKGQKISHGILSLVSSLSITSPLFPLYLSFQTDQTRASKYQRHQNKRTKDVSVVLGILSVSARVVRLGSSQ